MHVDLDWIDKKPDLHAEVVIPIMRSHHCGYASWSVTIRGNAFYMWSRSIDFTDYSACLVPGNCREKFATPSDIVADLVERFRSHAKDTVIRSEGFVFVTLPFMELQLGDRPSGRWVNSLEFWLDHELKPEISTMGFGFRNPPIRDGRAVRTICAFINRRIRPMNGIEQCVRFKMDTGFAEAVRKKNYRHAARMLERAAEQCEGIHWRDQFPEAAKTLRQRAETYTEWAVKQEQMSAKHIKAPRRGKDNIFSLINATRTLTKIGNEITSDH